MRQTHGLLFGLGLATALTLPAFAAPPRPMPAPAPAPVSPATQPLAIDAAQGLAAVHAAYRKVNTYQAVTQQVSVTVEGGWTTEQGQAADLLLDRKANRFRYETDNYTLASDGKKLRLISPHVPGVYMETDTPSPLTYEALVKLAPPLSQEPPTELLFLLAEKPLAGLEMTEDAPVTLQTGFGGLVSLVVGAADAPPWRLQWDPGTGLLDAAVRTYPENPADGSGKETLRLSVRDRKLDEPIPAERFTVDTTGATAVPDFQSMMTPGGAGQGAAGGNQGGGEHPLIGEPAPAVKLTSPAGDAYDLSKDKTPIIVLDFGGTLYRSSREWYPTLQTLHEWALTQKSIKVIAINEGDKPEKITEFWKDKKLSMPVLMDTAEGEVATAYAVSIVPQTVVIVDGKVQSIHVQLTPEQGKTLQATLQTLVDQHQPAEAPKSPAPMPAP